MPPSASQTQPANHAARSPEALIHYAYSHFNARNIDAVLSTMHPDVDWPNGMEGGRVLGHDAVREYWTRQWAMIDPHVEPIAFRPSPDGRTIVHVHQKVCDLSGTVLLDHAVEHIYDIRDGLIRSMEIHEID